MSNEIVKKESNDVRGWITSPEISDKIAQALPKHLTKDRFMRVALMAFNKNPKLLQCTRESLFQSFVTCSSVGLEPDGRLVHLIPYKDQCTVIIDYKGIAVLVKRNGDVANIHADVVCAGDEFDYCFGTTSFLKHKPALNRGEPLAAYSYVKNKDGSESFEVLSIDEINKVRDNSQGYRYSKSQKRDDNPWDKDYNEMAKKGLAVDTRIPTIDGWKKMGDLKIGNFVFDMNGIPTKVRSISDIKNIGCYKVTFSNGSYVICDEEHLWVSSYGSNSSDIVKKKGWKTIGIKKLYELKKSGIPITVPITKPLKTNNIEVKIDPWLLGYWIGNGDSNRPSITCNSLDLTEIVFNINKTKYKIGSIRNDSRSNATSIYIKEPFLSDLRNLNLLKNKHIPDIYMRSSINQRIDLLKGLMDSDGHISKERGRAMFGNCNVIISSSVFELAISLGEIVHAHSSKCKGYGKEVISHVVEWKPNIPPVSLSRKMSNFKQRKLPSYQSIKSIEKIKSVPTVCISVESDTKTYLAGESMVPTHNTAFRRHSKWLTLSPEIRDILEKEDEAESEAIKFEKAKPVKPIFEEVKEPESKVEVNDEIIEPSSSISPEEEREIKIKERLDTLEEINYIQFENAAKRLKIISQTKTLGSLSEKEADELHIRFDEIVKEIK